MPADEPQPEPVVAKARRCRPGFLVALAVAAVAWGVGTWLVVRERPVPIKPFPGVVSIRGTDSTTGQRGGATGFLLAPGRVITNWHVVANFDSAKVVVSSGRSFTVTGVLASDESADVAVLAVSMPDDAEMCLRPAGTPAVPGDRVTIVPEPRHRAPTPIVVEIEAIRQFPPFGFRIAARGQLHTGWSGSPALDSHGNVAGFVGLGAWGMLLMTPIERAVSIPDYDRAMTLSEWNSHQEPALIELARLRQTASSLFKSGDRVGALKNYQRAAELRPDDWMMLHNVAVCLSELGRHQEEIGVLDKVIQLLPNASEPLILRSDANDKLGRFEDEASDLERVLALDPSKPGARAQLGMCYERSDRYEDAQRELSIAVGQDPDDTWALGRLADVLIELGRFNEAITHLETLVKMEPEHARGNRLLGESYRELDRNEEALPFTRKALSIDPSNVRTHYLLGSLLYRLKQFPEALEVLTRARELDPKGDFGPFTMGAVYRDQGRWPEAVAAFQEADRLVPGENDTLHNLVAALLQVGRGDEAVSTAERMVAAHPTETLGYYVLADALETGGKHAEALAAIDRGLASAGDYSPLFLLRGDIYDTLGKPDLAVLAYQESLRVEPGLPAAHENLVKVYVKLGDFAKAREELRALEASDAEAAGRVRSLVPPE